MRQRHRQQPQPARLRGGHQRLQGRRVRQRYIAVQHQRCTVVRQMRKRLLHCVASTVLLGLQHEGQCVVGHRLRHGLAAKAIHHTGLVRAEFMGRSHHMTEQGFARQLVQDLGQV